MTDGRVPWRPAAALLAAATLCLAVFVAGVGAQETESPDYRPPDPADARRAACEVVGCERGTLPEPPDLPDVSGSPGLAVPGFVNGLIVAVLGVALVAGLYFAIRAIIRNRNSEDDGEDDTAEGIEVTVGSTRRLRPRTAADWAQLAQEAAQAGDWGRALRYRHRSGILHLDEEGHVRYRRGRTNGEYAFLLAARSPGAAGALRRLSRDVEDVQFGERPASSGMFGSAQADWGELDRMLAGPAHDTSGSPAGTA